MFAGALQAYVRGAAAATLVGFVGRWNGPVVIGLAIAGGLGFFDLARRDRAEQAHADRTRDRFGGPMQLAFLAILCAAAWDNRSHPPWRAPGVADALGLTVIACGARLRQRAARALGRHFTVGLSVRDDHQLVSSGPYRWLRHPNYAGLLLIALGTSTMVRSPTAAVVALSVWLPIMLLRIRDEERMLRGRLGVVYEDYSRRSWRLVPGVY